MSSESYPNQRLTRGRERGGEARAASICPTCHADLDDGQCSFCEREPSTRGFEDGDAAAREFLYRCGVIE